MDENLLILIDGSSYLYRAYHAMPNLSSPQGEPTGALYGVLNMLRSLIQTYDPKYLAIVFDAKGKNFRHQLYPAYKAHRPPMPDALQEQIAPLHQIIRAMHIPLLCIEGVEADDVIGTLCQQATQAGLKTLVSTGDKDMTQLVNADVTLINTMSNTLYDTTAVKEKFGVYPDKIIDLLALVGDTSDNIPGVAKVGPKTAEKWLDTYGSLAGVIAAAEDISGKIGDNLRAHLAQLPLNKQLVTIDCQVTLPYKIADLKPGEPDIPALKAHYQHYGFTKWLQALEVAEPQVNTQKNYHTILDKKSFHTLLEALQKADDFAFDTETTSLNYMIAQIVGLSFAITENEAYYIPVAHVAAEAADKQLPRDFVLTALKPLLENPAVKKLGHHLKYDKEVLANHGIVLRGIAHDTMLASYVLNSTASRHDLASLALKYLGLTTISYEDVAGIGAKQVCFDQVSLEKATEYAAEDADVTLKLHHYLWPKIAADEKLKSVYETIEIPLIEILAGMERTGVMIDCARLTAQSKVLQKRIESLVETAHCIAQSEFNLSSPKQLQAILYDHLQLPILKKTPKGQPSTAEEVLAELAINYELPRVILEHRSLSKLKSTYTDKLPLLINPQSGRIHTSYHQAVAGTGRLSSANPNLQNIPTRTEAGRQIRQAFIAPNGYKIVSADYSQVELRIMAHLSQDAGLLSAFAKGLDIHKATAAEVFNVSLSEVSAEQRRRAKAINFGLIYGMSAFGLAKQLGVEREAAQAYVDAYFEKYPGVADYMTRTRHQAHEKGYVETLFGRRLYLPEINSRNKMRQKAAERAAINAPMQGTAADIIKRAMIAIDHWLADSPLDARMIMQVHDELVFEVKAGFAEKLQKNVVALMSEAASLAVPLVVDANTGDNWDEAH